jgi:hypothetical protein
MRIGPSPRKWLTKKAKAGFRGYPVGTVAFYGADDRRATKVAVSIIAFPEAEPEPLRRWLADKGDVRTDDAIAAEIADFLRAYAVRTVAMADGIMGCPHEEGIDYPEGESCPHCPFWANRDRFAGGGSKLLA